MVVLTPDEYPHAGLEAKQAAAAMNLPERFLGDGRCLRTERQAADRHGNR